VILNSQHAKSNLLEAQRSAHVSPTKLTDLLVDTAHKCDEQTDSGSIYHVMRRSTVIQCM